MAGNSIAGRVGELCSIHDLRIDRAEETLRLLSETQRELLGAATELRSSVTAQEDNLNRLWRLGMWGGGVMATVMTSLLITLLLKTVV